MITKRRDGYGFGGTSLVASDPDDLVRLPKAARRLVSDVTADLFVRYPDSIRERAKTATFAPLRVWLEQLGERTCRLEVHRPGGPVSSSVMLRFHQAGRALAPAFVQCAERSHTALEPLREVDALVGGINLHYASSGFLSPAADRYTARSLVERLESQLPEEMREFAFYGRLDDYPAGLLDDAMSLWEADGDVLFYKPDGRTFWLGREHHTGEAGADWASLADAFEILFVSLANDRRFEPR